MHANRRDRATDSPGEQNPLDGDGPPDAACLAELVRLLPVERVPIDELLPPDSPRSSGEDDQHVRTLADSDVTYPPIPADCYVRLEQEQLVATAAVDERQAWRARTSVSARQVHRDNINRHPQADDREGRGRGVGTRAW